MTDSSLRTAIARVELEHRRVKAINYGAEYACLCGEVLRSNSHHVLADHRADAVLKVLADPPDDVIERAAEQIYYWAISLDWATSMDLEERPAGGQEDYREGARAAFRAAFGGEQT